MADIDWQLAADRYRGANLGAPQLTPPTAQPIDWAAAKAAYLGAPTAPAVQPAPVPEVPSAPLQETAPIPQPPAPVNSHQAMASMSQAAFAQGQAIADQAAAKAQGAQEQAKLADAQAAMEADHIAQAQQRQAVYQADRDKLANEFAALNKEVTDTKIHDSRSDGQKAMGILAVALGGLGDAVSKLGGNNDTKYGQTVYNGIQNAVERDLQLQREQLNNKRGAAQAKYNQLSMARQFFGDDQAAEDYVRAIRKDQLASQILAASQRSTIPVVQAQAAEAAAKLQSEAASTQAQLLTAIENNRRSSAAAAIAARTRADLAQNRPLTPAEQIAAERLQRDREADARRPEVIAEQPGAKLTEDLVVRDPKIAVSNAKSVDKTQEQIDAAKRMHQTIGEILDLRKQYTLAERAKDKVGMSDVGKRIDGLATSLTLDGKTVHELGALSGPDMGLMNGLTGDAKGWTSASDAQIRQLQNNVAKGTDEKLRTRGFEPVFNRPQADPVPAGERVPLIRQDASQPVRMQAPDGRTLLVPPDQVERLSKLGARAI